VPLAAPTQPVQLMSNCLMLLASRPADPQGPQLGSLLLPVYLPAKQAACRQLELYCNLLYESCLPLEEAVSTSAAALCLISCLNTAPD
jgi:hypothetical protein